MYAVLFHLYLQLYAGLIMFHIFIWNSTVCNIIAISIIYVLANFVLVVKLETLSGPLVWLQLNNNLVETRPAALDKASFHGLTTSSTPRTSYTRTLYWKLGDRLLVLPNIDFLIVWSDHSDRPKLVGHRVDERVTTLLTTRVFLEVITQAQTEDHCQKTYIVIELNIVIINNYVTKDPPYCYNIKNIAWYCYTCSIFTQLHFQ